MTIRVSPTGARGARVPKRGPLWKLFQLVGREIPVVRLTRET